jgi:hypothetical protein
MKPTFRTSLESCQSRAERVAAIKQAVKEGSYEIDSRNVANILIMHLLNHAARFTRPPLKRQCTVSQLTTMS